MAPRFLGNITLPMIVSRHEELSVKEEIIIDGTVHQNDLIATGTLLVKNRTTGKSVAYAEGACVAATATNSTAFSVVVGAGANNVQRAAAWFRPGMVIANAAGTVIGTVATFNPATGVGTFAANAVAVVAIGALLKSDPATYFITYAGAGVLEEQTLMDSGDRNDDVYIKGFFMIARTSITTTALSAMGGVVHSSDEVEIK